MFVGPKLVPYRTELKIEFYLPKNNPINKTNSIYYFDTKKENWIYMKSFIDTIKNTLYTNALSGEIFAVINEIIPPVISSQINAEEMAGFSAFALPPVPEEIPDGYDFIRSLAVSRSDDLIYGGTFNESNLIESAQSVNNQVENYSELYKKSQSSYHQSIPESSEDLNVQNVMLSLMS